MRKLAGELGCGIAMNVAVMVGTSLVLALISALIAGAAGMFGLFAFLGPFLLFIVGPGIVLYFGLRKLRNRKLVRRNKNAGLAPDGEACLKPEYLRIPPPADASFFDP